MTTAHRVGRVEEVPEGRAKVYRVKGREYVVFHIDGEFHAMERKCAPRDVPLERAMVVNGDVLCPWHGWRFDVRDGRCSMVPDEPTPVFRMRTDGEELLIEI